MSTFKVGDVVICIDAKLSGFACRKCNTTHILKLGEEYLVIKVDSNSVVTLSAYAHSIVYSTTRFELAPKVETIMRIGFGRVLEI